MKRWALRIAVLLLVGAVVNVLVAWACALWSPYREYSGGRWTARTSSDGVTERAWDVADPTEVAALDRLATEVDAYALAPLEQVAGQSFRFLDVWEHRGFGVRRGGIQHGREVLHALSAGWPALAVECRGSGQGRFGDPGWDGWRVPGALRPIEDDRVSPGSPAWARPVPVRPRWVGFGINSPAYAAVLWCVLLIPGGVRGVLRRRCGRCGSCGYDLSGLRGHVCPECGEAVRA